MYDREPASTVGSGDTAGCSWGKHVSRIQAVWLAEKPVCIKARFADVRIVVDEHACWSIAMCRQLQQRHMTIRACCRLLRVEFGGPVEFLQLGDKGHKLCASYFLIGQILSKFRYEHVLSSTQKVVVMLIFLGVGGRQLQSKPPSQLFFTASIVVLHKHGPKLLKSSLLLMLWTTLRWTIAIEFVTICATDRHHCEWRPQSKLHLCCMTFLLKAVT